MNNCSFIVKGAYVIFKKLKGDYNRVCFCEIAVGTLAVLRFCGYKVNLQEGEEREEEGE